MTSTVSLKNYLSRHFAVVAVLPVITIAALTWCVMTPAIKTRTGIRHQAVARSIAGQISAHLAGGKRQLTALADYLNNRRFWPDAALTDLLDAHCGNGEFFEALFVVNHTGDIVQAAGLARAHRQRRSDYIGMDFSGRWFIYSVKDGSTPVWSKIFLSTVNGRPAVALTIPMADGFIIGELTLDNLSEFISHLPVESEFLTLVTDDLGIVMADSKGRYWGHQMFSTAFVAGTQSADNPRAISDTFELNGQKMLGTVVETDETDWKILVAQPFNKALQPLWDTLALIGLGLVLALVLALPVGSFLAGKFTLVFNSYAKGAASVADGYYDLQWPGHKTEEFSLLGQSLARMADKINRREKELRNLRNYLSNIIDSMPSVLVGVDNNGVVTQWNRRAEQVTGIRSEMARCQPLDRVFPGLTQKMDHIKTSIRERRVISDPKVSRRQAQETRYEDVTIYPLIANGVEGAVIRVDDVTEKVRLEEMMIQGEKMLTVGGLAAGMAHEINNPLAGMMQTAGVMAGRLGTKLDIPANRKAAEEAGTTVEAVARFMELRGIPRMLETINESGRRVAEIVENMLSFARKSDAAVLTQDLGKLLDKTLKLAVTDYDLKKKYDFKRIIIEKDYGEPPVSAPCEETKIQQVLLNILRNGAEAMGDTVSPRFIFRTRQERDTAVMEIEDNGPGMDETTRKKVFEPFFTTKPVGVGTGLGLSVSYFIITENHGGEMTVESGPGSGAKFIIRLPVKTNHVIKLGDNDNTQE